LGYPAARKRARPKKPASKSINDRKSGRRGRKGEGERTGRRKIEALETHADSSAGIFREERHGHTVFNSEVKMNPASGKMAAKQTKICVGALLFITGWPYERR
jgi:hypothetical protein